MATLNGLPVYKIKINADLENKTGIDFVSLVDYPAIESNWVAMSNDKKHLKFNSESDKQLLLGPILIPDFPIYRFDMKMGEFYVIFTKEEIEKLVRKFQASLKSINLNYQHQKDSQLKSAVIQEIWLTGKNDKSKDFGFDLPEGSAFVVAHIGDKKFWDEEVKTKNVMGFSIEGFLDMELRNINKQNMSNQKFITAKTDTGVEMSCDGEKFETGMDIYATVDGNKTPAPDGEHKLENGTVLTVEAGKIVSITEAQSTEDEADKVIQSAVKPLIDELKKEFEASLKTLKSEYESQIKELKTKLSNLPGSPAATSNTDGETKQMTPKEALAFKLETLKKKNKELNEK